MIGSVRKGMLLAFTALAASAVYAWIGGVTTQSFIGHGWDLMRAKPEEIFAHADDFAHAGLDGVTVCLYGKNSAGARCGFSTIMTDAPWDDAVVASNLETLRKFRTTSGLKKSFLMFWLAPQKRIAWDDDDAWAQFASNLGVLAKLGVSAGMKGYFVDGEDYPKTRQFFYDKSKDSMDFDAACVLARRRGSQTFKSLFAAHPDAVLLSFWFLSLDRAYAYLRDPAKRMRQTGDLWPSFVNGILDVMPNDATFVDGDEHAYNYDSSKRDFLIKSFNQWHSALGLVMPENRAKYSGSLSVGFGIYLDMYTKHGDVKRLERNLAQAAEVSTEYVWIYGERNNWVPWSKVGNQTWEQALPGLSEMLQSIRDPEGFIKEKLAKLNADGGIKGIQIPQDRFWTWKDKKSNAVFSRTDDVWEVSAGNGSVLAGISVQEGELYAASMAVCGENSEFKGNVHWRRKGAFDFNKAEFPIYFGEQDKDGWRRGTVAARVPADVDELVIQCDAIVGNGGKVRISNFGAVRLRP